LALWRARPATGERKLSMPAGSRVLVSAPEPELQQCVGRGGLPHDTGPTIGDYACAVGAAREGELGRVSAQALGARRLQVNWGGWIKRRGSVFDQARDDASYYRFVAAR
jgi:hypothetical protein